jgi:hypothetical protein
LAILGIWLLTAAWAGPVWGFEVVAEVDRREVHLNESLTLTVTVKSGRTGEVDVSSIEGFKVSPRGQSSQVMVTGGRVSEMVEHYYLLTPKKIGEYTIGPLAVTVRGETAMTEPLTVRVLPPAETGGAEVFIQAESTRGRPYAGETFTYHLKIFMAVEIGAAQLRPPDFGELTAKKLPDDRTYVTEMDGQRYNVTRVDYLVTPFKPGRVVIGPAELYFEVMTRSTRGMFQMAMPESRVVKSNPVTLTVRPKPEYDGDAPDSGLVGRFELTAEAARRDLTQGRSTTVTVKLSGVGGLQDAGDLPLSAPAGLKVYADEPEKDLRATEEGMAGTVTFSYAVVALEPGEYTLPAIQTAYFDPVEGQYRLLETRPIPIRVAPSAEAAASPAPSPPPPPQKEAVALRNGDILSIKTDADVLADRGGLSTGALAVLLAIPPLLLAAFLGGLRFSGRNAAPRRKMARQAEARLKEAAAAEDQKAGLALIRRALIDAVYARAGREGRNPTYDETEVILKTYANRAAAAQIIDLLKRLDAALYGRAELAESAWADLLHGARAAIRELHK